MWGQTIFPGSPPFKWHVYICCIIYFIFILYYSFFSTPCIVRKSHSFFSQKEGPLLRCRIDGTTESVMVAYTHKYAKV